MEDKPFDTYIHENILEQIVEDFNRYAEHNSEGIGLLCGKVRKWKEKKYVIIEEYVTAENDSNEVRARFSREAFTNLAKQLKDKTIVGWAHSHPNYSCFLSKTDIDTHKQLFNEEYQVALVIDPLNTRERPETRFFKVTENNYSEVSYAVIKWQNERK